MISRYEIQGRIIERAAGKVVRDEVRHASRDSIEAAMQEARAFTEAGFTAWIFKVRPGTATPLYELLQHTQPVRVQASPQPTPTRPTRRPARVRIGDLGGPGEL